jgi:hypothetical protein
MTFRERTQVIQSVILFIFMLNAIMLGGIVLSDIVHSAIAPSMDKLRVFKSEIVDIIMNN